MLKPPRDTNSLRTFRLGKQIDYTARMGQTKRLENAAAYFQNCCTDFAALASLALMLDAKVLGVVMAIIQTPQNPLNNTM